MSISLALPTSVSGERARTPRVSKEKEQRLPPLPPPPGTPTSLYTHPRLPQDDQLCTTSATPTTTLTHCYRYRSPANDLAPQSSPCLLQQQQQQRQQQRRLRLLLEDGAGRPGVAQPPAGTRGGPG